MTQCTTVGDAPRENFQSQRISRTASFVLDANIARVFPLYGAFEERKWAPGWEPTLIYPAKEVIEEGTTFTIEPQEHDYDEGGSRWIVSKYEPEQYLIQYLVSTNNRFWTITVKSEPVEKEAKTKTAVTYTYTGLNEVGNQRNKKSMDTMFAHDLQDWAALINAHLALD